ncbi:AsnC family transcriptional regulator [Haladaptatus pallidirubidus]|uniref:AsnC family transcriptional regulator n=1 Tax=Haladaptatus pallidirubidus TaxID=1008152 RepID=A0AAV3UPI3_9EURY|nr:AsnC family transcriptional regulator [Haladaptatus pallidirubidus]
MRKLDEVDMEILRVLIEDARRPYSSIAEMVNLSAPTVSDRIDRLEEEGIIRQFTVDVDRHKLEEGIPVLVDLSIESTAVESVSADLEATDVVEHLFMTADSRVVFQAHVKNADIRGFLASVVDTTVIQEFDVDLLVKVTWAPQMNGTRFALDCDECGNNVTSEGVTTQLNGSVYHFCCTSCQGNFESRYDRFDEAA